MLKKRYLFLIILVCLFAISAVSAAEISNETNMVANDDSSLMTESVNEDTLSVSLSEKEIQGSADNGTFTALQKKINEASEGSIINLENNYTYDSEFQTDGIFINKELTINGNGYVIDALGQSRIFYIITPTVTLNNITFKNGYSSEGGTIFGCYESDILLVNSSFYNSHANSKGGVFYSSDYKVNLTILNCNFENNTVDDKTSANCGGAIYFEGKNSIIINSTFMDSKARKGGAIFCNGDNAFILNSSFINGYAFYYGAAVYMLNNGSIHDSKFINNSVTGVSRSEGGAIYWKGNNGYVNNSTFINNTAIRGGGAIYWGGEKGCINNSIFLYNTLDYRAYSGAAVAWWGKNGRVLNSYFGFNKCLGSGALFWNAEKGILYNSTFINNTAASGGAIGVVNAEWSDISINSSIFINNNATVGGAIAGGNINLLNSIFINNNADDGGAICGGNMKLLNSIFNNNSAKSGSSLLINDNNTIIDNSLFINNKGTDTGTIHIISDNVIVSKSILINNTGPYDVYSTVYTTVANNNWFGNTLDTQTIRPKVSNDVIVDNWHYLKVTANSETLKVGESAIITIDLNGLSNNKGDVSYKNELSDLTLNITSLKGVCDVSNVQLKDGKAKITFKPTEVGYGRVTVNYLTASQAIDFLIKDNRIEPNMTFNVENKHVGETVEIDGFLPSDATGNVVVTINNKTYSAKINKGEANVLINNLPTNKYDFIMDYGGDTKYSFDHVNGSFIVSKVSDYNITTSNLSIIAREIANVVVYVPSDATGNIFLKILTGEYTVPVKGGKATISIPNLSSNMMYGFYAFLIDDPKYEMKDVYGTITVSKVSDYPINAPDVDAISTEPTNIIVNVPLDATGKITVIIGESKGWSYIEDGTATIKVTYPTKGNYTFVASYEGDDKYTPKDTYGVLRVHKVSDYPMNTTDIYIEKGEVANIVVYLPSDASGTANVEVYNDEYRATYTATVYDGKIIVNEHYITKNSKFLVNYLGDKKYEPKSVSGSIFVKSSIIINAPDITKYYGGSERFVVTVKDKDNKPISGAEVKIHINGQTYTKTTDNNGETSMGINLNSGVYNVTTVCNETEVYSSRH